jgi:hypothetical protein
MSKRKPPKRGSTPARKPAANSKAKKPAPRKSAARSTASKKKPAARRAAASRTQPVAAPIPLLADDAARPKPSLAPQADADWSFSQMVKRVDLSDRKTRIALASVGLVIALIAAAVAWPSSPKDTDVLAGNEENPAETADEVAEEEGPAAEDGPDEEGPAEKPVTASEDPAVANPNEDRAQALKIGSMIHPQSTSLPNGDPNTWVGVTKDSIKFAIAYDKSNCGVNTLTLAQQTTANLPSDNRYYRENPKNQDTVNKEFEESAKVLVEVVNRRGLEGGEDFPNIRKLMGNDPKHPYYGRRINLQIVDGGSYQCPETTRAAALKIVEDIKPFVVINDDGLSRAGYNMAAQLNTIPEAKRPMHFGTLSESDSLYKKWAPFAWTQFASGTSQIRQYASWLCSRIVGKNAVNSPQYKGAKRKVALLYPNFQQVKTIADELKAFAKSYCGANPFATEFAYDTNPARASDQGTTIAVRLKSEGITSVAYLLDLFSPLFHIIAMKSQDYRPEFVFTPTNYLDSSTVQRIYEQDMVDKSSFGITSLGVPGGFGYTAGDPFYAYHDLHKKAPNGKACDPSSDAGMDHSPTYCKAPRAIVTLYYSVLPLLGGILFAGPDLNPTNVTNGLQEYPKTRYGGSGPTTDPRPALVGAGDGRFYFIVDATEWRWRAGFVSPAPERNLGWVEWPDCQRHYILWPSQLAPGWEKGGENYSAWCGNAKYASKPYAPGPTTGEACEDTPSGKCETDNYPPHPPEGKRP